MLNANNDMKYLLIILLIASCSTIKPKLVVPEYSCKQPEILLDFEEVTNLDSALRNAQKSKIYFWQQHEYNKNSETCYKKVITEITK